MIYILFLLTIYIYILNLSKFSIDTNNCPLQYRIIASGSSDNHFHLLLLFLYRLHKVENKICIIVWDLGLSKGNIKQLNNAKMYIESKRFILFIYKFNYGIYPSHFNININAGYYSWKPFIIWNTYIKFKKNMLWLDCGCYIINKLDYEYDIIKKKIIYTISAGSTIARYTHHSLFNILNVSKSIYNKTMCAGGVVGLYYPSKKINYILSLWKACALIKNCISPEGANRSNHRQDQSVFSILLYQNDINFTFSRKKGFKEHFDKPFKKYINPLFNKFVNLIS